MTASREIVIQPGQAAAVEVHAGGVIQVVDAEGEQVSDFVAFTGPKWRERLSPPTRSPSAADQRGYPMDRCCTPVCDAPLSGHRRYCRRP
ncbi:MAG: DUF1989 domain-containing protein [Streptosporangiaceae bacterium]